MTNETNTQRLDATGRNIEEGDTVVYSDTQRETSSLKVGQIVGFTSKKVRLLIDNMPWRIGIGEPARIETLKFPEQIARIN